MRCVLGLMLLAFVWPWVLLSVIPDVPAWTASPLAAAALVVHVETAGHSGTTGAEAVLEGLDDWDGVYDRIMQALLAYRGRPMDATGAGEEPSAETAVASSAVLTELQAIRRLLDERLPRN
jgi:hypothetical protein